MPQMSPAVVEAHATSYSVVAADGGKILTTRGAGGTVTFTLPATNTIYPGWQVEFFNAAGQTMTVASATTDTMTTFNDLTADSVTYSTVSELIGGALRCVWDGTGWLTFAMAYDTQTQTVAT